VEVNRRLAKVFGLERAVAFNLKARAGELPEMTVEYLLTDFTHVEREFALVLIRPEDRLEAYIEDLYQKARAKVAEIFRPGVEQVAEVLR
jgi:hypothetical protein